MAIDFDNSISDMFYTRLPTGGPTQGDVWSNLPDGISQSIKCLGLIITPRCDFAHSKSPVVNYLPIVSLEHYLLSTGCFALLEQALNDANDGMKRRAQGLGVDHLIDIGVPLDQVVESLRIQHISSISLKKTDKTLQEFLDFSERIDVLKALNKKKFLSWGEAREYINAKQIRRLKRDIIKNNTWDTFFLPPCSDLIGEPSVVLIRHIFICPIGYLQPLSKSISSSTSDLPQGDRPERLLRLRSPFIEALMSKLSALFGRVGTRDIPEQAVNSYLLRGEGQQT